MEKFLFHLKSSILYLLIFLFPLFFLTFTQEYFVTNKLYLLGFGVLLLILISTIQILISKKLSWQKHPFDSFVLLFLTAMAISIVLSSPNKIQALLNPSFGLVMMVSLAVLYFYISRQHKGPSSSFSSDEVGPYIMKILSFSAFLLSVVTIVFYFQPFNNVSLPQNLAFLKNPTFTPVGSQLDLAILLGFFVAWGIVSFPRRWESRPKWIPVFTGMTLTITLLALSLTVYSLLQPLSPNNQSPITNNLLLPPFRLSWYAALEVLKTPASALVGIGVDNFSSVFTQVKDLAYNQSPLWQINSFTVSRSAILQILTETGIFGLLAFGLLVFALIRELTRIGTQKYTKTIEFGYVLLVLIFFPPSLISWFLFFLVLSTINHQPSTINNQQSFDLSPFPPIYLGIAVISFLLISTSGYFLGRSYASEYYFKKSFDGISQNNIKVLYDNQRRAIIINPYIERFRGNFAQVNLLVANNLAQKNPKNISEQDRQTITQAIQSAIAEGKAVVSLNPRKADGWQNLASVYFNVINVAEGADVWTISAYQRAILADPQNPTYRVGLGGVYYSLQKYDDALRFFEQAISLKPDWPNASYNYAWANFQKENYPQAVNAMQNVISLLDSKLSKDDYKKAQAELSEFKKMLPKEGETPPVNKPEAYTQSNLSLPTPPVTQISPKIELPKEASPEAK